MPNPNCPEYILYNNTIYIIGPRSSNPNITKAYYIIPILYIYNKIFWFCDLGKLCRLLPYTLSKYEIVYTYVVCTSWRVTLVLALPILPYLPPKTQKQITNLITYIYILYNKLNSLWFKALWFRLYIFEVRLAVQR